MTQRTKYFGAGLALVFILGGCGSTVQGFQPAASGPPPPTLANVSGQYQGTANGIITPKTTANLAQTGSAVGGTLTLPASRPLTVALALASNGTLTGTATNTNNHACTFSVSATYSEVDAAHPQLSGSYSPEHGCAGQNGNFVLKQICVYRNARQAPDALRRRNPTMQPNSGLHPC